MKLPKSRPDDFESRSFGSIIVGAPREALGLSVSSAQDAMVFNKMWYALISNSSREAGRMPELPVNGSALRESETARNALTTCVDSLRRMRLTRITHAFLVVFGLWSCSQTADAQSILPPAEGSIGGGNPLQGLGRPDDPSPSRYKDFAQKNLQNIPSSGSGAFSSDILNKSSLDNPEANPTETLNKLLSPDGLKSLIGTDGQDGSGSDAASGGGLPSNSLEFTDKAGASFADQLSGSNGGDSPAGESGVPVEESRTPARYGSSAVSASSNSDLSKTGSDDGNVGLPPEPPGLAAPINSPSLAVPLKATSLSGTPEKTEAAKNGTKSAQAKAVSVSDHASTRGALADVLSRKASPLSTSVSDRIRQAIEGHGRVEKPKPEPQKAEHLPPPEVQLVPAPPPLAVAPSGPTPERQALALMKVGKYPLAEQQLRDLISTDPDNLHARYLFAVTLVFNKKYDEAKNNYGIIIRKSQDKRLVEMAETGLQKLMH